MALLERVLGPAGAPQTADEPPRHTPKYLPKP